MGAERPTRYNRTTGGNGQVIMGNWFGKNGLERGG